MQDFPEQNNADSAPTPPLKDINAERRLALSQVITPVIIPGIAFFFGGIFLLYISTRSDAKDFLLQFISSGNAIIAIFGISMIVAPVISITSLYKKRFENKPVEFIDIDKNNNIRKIQKNDYDNTLNTIKSFNIHLMEQKKFDSFQEYFTDMRIFLDAQIDNADQKASLLLDNGKNYSNYGIYFYIFSVACWQIVMFFSGFQPQHLYGIACCSLIFIFIEFLSAWFLKQYRHYVDTSTHLIKIKSILERYFLAYLAIKESNDNSYSSAELIAMLKEDIKWPETYLTKTPDVSFAKECMETATQLIRSIKPETKKD